MQSAAYPRVDLVSHKWINALFINVNILRIILEVNRFILIKEGLRRGGSVPPETYSPLALSNQDWKMLPVQLYYFFLFL